MEIPCAKFYASVHQVAVLRVVRGLEEERDRVRDDKGRARDDGADPERGRFSWSIRDAKGHLLRSGTLTEAPRVSRTQRYRDAEGPAGHAGRPQVGIYTYRVRFMVGADLVFARNHVPPAVLSPPPTRFPAGGSLPRNIAKGPWSLGVHTHHPYRPVALAALRRAFLVVVAVPLNGVFLPAVLALQAATKSSNRRLGALGPRETRRRGPRWSRRQPVGGAVERLTSWTTPSLGGNGSCHSDWEPLIDPLDMELRMGWRGWNDVLGEPMKQLRMVLV